jgi:alkanesulfonate monooxygenase SsuD/methylene tetrahydromethanopterin reductase-like flavin-dependent oxidoreductase (luciferase family)
MQLGFNLPISGPNSAPRSLARLAQEGEAMGYDYLTLTDHVVLPDVSSPGYPYSESGDFIANAPTERHELLTATSFIAAKTSRIRLVLAIWWCRIVRRYSQPRCCLRSTCYPRAAWSSASAPAG